MRGQESRSPRLLPRQHRTAATAKVENPLVVRHEMLHELLGRGDHPAEYFQRRCGSVVICNEVCREDE